MLSVPTEFTPLASLAGGALIGLSAVLVMLFFGRIGGISGITLQAMRPPAQADRSDWGWRVAFIMGLISAPALVSLVTGRAVAQTVPGDLAAMSIAGLLVGFGATLGSGCTSGHGVCGLARLSRRSSIAVVVFMGAAFTTVFVLRHIAGV